MTYQVFSAFETKVSVVASVKEAPETLIVVPCYNEETRLDVHAFSSFLAANADIAFVFVNDGSRDGTLDVLSGLKRAFPDRVTVLSLSQNSGKAEAVRQGLLHATATGAELTGYWDADLATPLSSLPDFLAIARRHLQVAVILGSRRALLGHRIDRTPGRRAVSAVCAMLARRAVALPVADTQCGVKLLRNTAALKAAVAQPFTTGWLFDVELIGRLADTLPRRQAFYELPLSEWNEVAGSKVKPSAIVKSGLRMLRLIAERRLGLRLARPAAAPVPTAVEVLPQACLPVRAAA